MQIKSSKLDFVEDLKDLLDHLHNLKLNTKLEFPPIGMGLWHADRNKVLEIFSKYNEAERNNIIFRMYINDRKLMRTI